MESNFMTRDGCFEAFIDQKKRADALESQLAEARARIEALTGTDDGATESGAMFCQANVPPPSSGAKEGK